MIYVIQVTPMNELKVRAALEREGISAYVPRRELIIRKAEAGQRLCLLCCRPMFSLTAITVLRYITL